MLLVIRTGYERRLLIKLSEDLTRKFGRGFSVDNLQLMRKFYTTFPGKQIYETPSRKSQIQQTLSIKSQKFKTVFRKFTISQRYFRKVCFGWIKQ